MSSIDEAARILVEARKAGRQIDGLPESCRPADLEAGLAIQQRVVDLVGQPIGGWKAGMPPPGRIFVAPIFAHDIHSGPTCPVLSHGAATASVEPEIAFVLGRDLPPRKGKYSEAEIREAIGETRLVLEILGARYFDSASRSFPEQLADSLTNQGLFVGPVLAHGLDRSLEAFHVKIEGPSGTVFEKDGKHPTGHPLPPLAWLVAFLNERGLILRRGDIVTTGSYAGAVDVPIGVPLRFHFGDLGVLAVQFSAS